MSDKPTAKSSASAQEEASGSTHESKYPREWMNDVEDDEFFESWRAQHAELEALGVPSHRVTKDESGNWRMLPRRYASTQSAGLEATAHEVHTEYITLIRKVDADRDRSEPLRGVMVKMEGKERVEEESVCVPIGEAEALKAKGWKV